MKKKIAIVFILVSLVYVSSYLLFRQTHTEIWEEDKNEYVIFPENKILYYVYRPLTLADGAITGMRFHIGQHQ